MAVEPVDPTLPPDAEIDPGPEPSLAEHEQEFGGGKPPSRPEPDPEPEPDDERPRAARDATGKFTKERHRAKSQQAGPADVPRIAELTRRLREAETERDALKARPAPAAPAAPPATPAPAAPTAATAKPKIDDFQDYGEYVEAVADWKIAEARRVDRETSQKDAEAARVATSWKTRVDAAKTKYADFDAVALQAPTTIPQGSVIDGWILEHPAGADVLYTLQSNPTEIDRILALPLFEQVEALTLLSQRVAQPARELAVKTGAAATPVQKVAPRPPTPVRTSAVPAADEPPGDDASLAEHERFYGSRRRA
jgi:hypothetical protein